MDKQTKTILVIIISIILIVVALKLIFKYWDISLAGAIAFIFGYVLGVRKGKS